MYTIVFCLVQIKFLFTLATLNSFQNKLFDSKPHCTFAPQDHKCTGALIFLSLSHFEVQFPARKTISHQPMNQTLTSKTTCVNTSVKTLLDFILNHWHKVANTHWFEFGLKCDTFNSTLYLNELKCKWNSGHRITESRGEVRAHRQRPSHWRWGTTAVYCQQSPNKAFNTFTIDPVLK